MANKQINELNELTTASGTDLVAVYDLNEGGSEKTKKMTLGNFFKSGWIYTPEVATTAGTALTIASDIPDSASEIEIFFDGVSTSSNDDACLIQIGDSGGIETTGYVCNAGNLDSGPASESFTVGFAVANNAAQDIATLVAGSMRLSRWALGEHLWIASGVVALDGTAGNPVGLMAGKKTLSGALTQIRITTEAGTPTFDAGKIRVRYR